MGPHIHQSRQDFLPLSHTPLPFIQSYSHSHLHPTTAQIYLLSLTFILTYISLEKTSFHSLTHLFHSYNLPTHSHLAGSLQPCTFRPANFLSCFLGRKTTERQGFPALCSPSLLRGELAF